MSTASSLLSRDEFRRQVFARFGVHCSIPGCRERAVDAHHIIERRLFPDGGYYLDNGAALCEEHHLTAESTVLDAQRLRDLCGIKHIVLPPHLYPDERYDKWGNVILPNGTRLQGELFDDPSVQKILAPVLHLFHNRVKYPRTWHLPWSGGVTDDDRVLPDALVDSWSGRDVVVTEKMDGENTTLYSDYLHARSVDYSPHPSRSFVRNLHASICGDIPKDYRVCGENLWAQHSIAYDDLSAYFLVFSIWHRSQCLAWDETVEWATLLGLQTVPVLYRGTFHGAEMFTAKRGGLNAELDENLQEGYVVRPAASFMLRDFPTVVGKYVRAQHVRTHGHWMRSVVVKNKLKDEG
jgi:hypothetical protein